DVADHLEGGAAEFEVEEAGDVALERLPVAALLGPLAGVVGEAEGGDADDGEVGADRLKGVAAGEDDDLVTGGEAGQDRHGAGGMATSIPWHAIKDAHAAPPGEPLRAAWATMPPAGREDELLWRICLKELRVFAEGLVKEERGTWGG